MSGVLIPFPGPYRPVPRIPCWHGDNDEEVHHKSRSSRNWALHGCLDTRETAIAFAPASLPAYPGSLLGETEA